MRYDFFGAKSFYGGRFLMEKLDSVEITINLHSATHRSFYLCISHSATVRSFYLCTHRSYYLCITHADVQDNRVTTPWIWSACTFWHISSTVKKQNKEHINFSVLSGTARKKSLHFTYQILEYYTKSSSFPTEMLWQHLTYPLQSVSYVHVYK